MFDFFNEFFESELAKNNIVTIIIIVVLLLFVGAFFMWLYMEKIYMKCLSNENVDLKKQVDALQSEKVDLKKKLEEVTANRDALLAQDNRLVFYDKLTKAKEFEETEMVDEAIEQFLND